MEWNYTVILNENILLYVMEYFAIWKGINCHMEWNILLYWMEYFYWYWFIGTDSERYLFDCWDKLWEIFILFIRIDPERYWLIYWDRPWEILIWFIGVDLERYWLIIGIDNYYVWIVIQFLFIVGLFPLYGIMIWWEILFSEFMR